MHIRQMTITDYDEIYALFLSCKGMGLNDLDDSREGIERFLKRNPDTCFVAESNGGIVGVIMVGNDGRRGYIYHTAVHPDCRRRGIARALVERTIEALRALGIHKVALVGFRRNEGGNASWERMGFTVREDITYRNRTLDEMIRYDS